MDVENAAYINSWTDIEVSNNGFPLKMARTYRSRSNYNGIFGYGWCSEYESKLSVTPEGGVLINQCGENETYFFEKEIGPQQIEQTVQKILEKVKASAPNKIPYSDSYVNELADRLRKEPALREKYVTEKNLTKGSVAPNTKLKANGRNFEHIVFSKKHYTRYLSDGSLQRYDIDGKLTHIYSKTGSFLKFTYSDNRISDIEDSESHRLSFKYDNLGKVKKISGPNGLTVEYSYQPITIDLSEVKITNYKKETTIYKYDYNEQHNLIKAVWPDKTFISIKYDIQKDWVTQFTDRDACTEDYKYEFAKNNPSLHYWATSVKTCEKSVKTRNRFEFWQNKTENGKALARVLTDVDGQTKDVTYDQLTGKPQKIKVNKKISEYSYYENGLLKTKTTKEKKQEFTYDNEVNRVSEVKITLYDDKSNITEVSAYSYKYDKLGNMISAQDSKGKKIDLTYDLSGRIKTVLENGKKRMTLEYDEANSKPISISRDGQGRVVFAYNTDGSISKISGKGSSSETAASIANEFNNLLAIVNETNSSLYE